MENFAQIDVFDPVDIAIMMDPEVQKMMDSIEDHESDYETLFAGLKESCEDDDEDAVYDDDDTDEYDDFSDVGIGDDEECSTYDAIDDGSLDPLDIEADDKIDCYEDDDSDGELIDIIMDGMGIAND